MRATDNARRNGSVMEQTDAFFAFKIHTNLREGLRDMKQGHGAFT
jgi:hypothetical protein